MTLHVKRRFFCSGPTAKPREWRVDHLNNALLHRSHRSAEGITRIREILRDLRDVLQVPHSHHIMLWPGGGTGAIEAVLWNAIHPHQPVTCIVWDVFSSLWHHDIVHELQHPDVTAHHINPNHPWATNEEMILKDFASDRDVVFTWCGTTAGLAMHGQALKEVALQNTKRLIIADAAAALFCMPIDYDLCDVVTGTLQKGLGSEGGNGIIILGPKAYERLLRRPEPSPWPIPRLLRMHDTNDVCLIDSIAIGHTVNTPSMLALEDTRQLLRWAQGIKGYKGLIERAYRNKSVVESFLAHHTDWRYTYDADGLWQSPSVATIKPKSIATQSQDQQWLYLKDFASELAKRSIAFDVLGHPHDAPTLRFWLGPTIEACDLEAALSDMNAYLQSRSI